MGRYLNKSLDDIVEIVNGIQYKEIWRPVIGYEKHYSISSFGRVYSIRGGFIMRQHLNDKGYPVIALIGDAVKKKLKVHRIVCTAFHPNPSNKPQVNHEDFNKANNFYLNLSWATAKENTNHAQAGGRTPTAKPKPPKRERPVFYNKVIDTETQIVYDSAECVASMIGVPTKELTRRLNGERVNNTKYKYVKGNRTKVYPKEKAEAEKRFLQMRPIIYGCAI